MNENIDLTKILKDVPKGTKFYTSVWGEVEFVSVDTFSQHPLCVRTRGLDMYYITSKGTLNNVYSDAECIIFPSKDQRDWSKFEVSKKKVKVTLHPFDKVLVRDGNQCTWLGHLIMGVDNTMEYPFMTNFTCYAQCIPYTAETAHLLGTTDTPLVEYEIEFDKSFKE